MTEDDMAGERDFNERNIEEFRQNGGKVGGQFEGFPLLLLTSTGAKSGAERINLIGYFDIDKQALRRRLGGGPRQQPRVGVQLARTIPTCRSRSARIRRMP